MMNAARQKAMMRGQDADVEAPGAAAASVVVGLQFPIG